MLKIRWDIGLVGKGFEVFSFGLDILVVERGQEVVKEVVVSEFACKVIAESLELDAW